MAISLQCECGRSARVKDELAGKKVRCPQCKAILAVPVPEPPTPEDDALDVLMTAEAPKPKAKPPKRRHADADDDEGYSAQPTPKRKQAKRDDDDEDGYSSKPIPKRRPVEDDEDDEPAPRPKKKKALNPWKASGRPGASRREERGYGFGIAVSPTIISGLLMMLGAVVWFVLGIVLIDRIFFYPPIMFVLGIAAVVRGVMGHED